MFKLKVYGVFIALIYSFFFHALNHQKDYSVRKGLSIESQIRSAERRQQKGITTSQHTQGAAYSLAGREGAPPEIQETFLPGKSYFSKPFLQPDDTPHLFYKSIATERHRVLRN